MGAMGRLMWFGRMGSVNAIDAEPELDEGAS
jgi:hypothetical protein